MSIAQSPQNEQKPLREAYESGELGGHKFLAAKRLLETRRRCGKGIKRRANDVKTPKDGYTARDIIKTYKREVERKRLLARKADMVTTKLLFLVEALHSLTKEDHFTTLLLKDWTPCPNSLSPF